MARHVVIVTVVADAFVVSASASASFVVFDYVIDNALVCIASRHCKCASREVSIPSCLHFPCFLYCISAMHLVSDATTFTNINN